MIDMLTQDYPVTLVCDTLGMARSSYYHQAAEAPEEAKLKETAAEWPTYGCRRMTEQLNRRGWAVNRLSLIHI